MTNNIYINSIQTNQSILKVDIIGYVLPKNEYFENFKNDNQKQLIEKLYLEFDDQLINYIKGFFVIVIQDKDKTLIFNDHLGIKKIFYKKVNENYEFSNTIVKLNIKNLNINPLALTYKSIFNREMLSETIFNEIKVLPPATKVTIQNQKTTFEKYWQPENLLKNPDKKYTIDYFKNLLVQNIKNLNDFLKPAEYSITLTGGKDSRTGLCTLLNQGIKPIGLTYGSKDSKDAVYAKKVAVKAAIDHHVFDMPKTIDTIKKTIDEIVALKMPFINIHRAHRYFAFKQLSQISSKNQAYLAGYMAGELLMGIYYDHTVFSKIITDFWETNEAISKETIEKKLKDHFIKLENINLDLVIQQLAQLKNLDPKNSKFEKQFHGIFEIGIPHHAQDINLSATILDYPYPFFLDLDFLEALFKSKYHFKYTDNKSKNIFKRYQLYYFNMKLQHALYPKLSQVPFGKKGNYTTLDFLKGNLYWSLVKIKNYILEKEKYKSSFAYDEKYYTFAVENLEAINNDKNHSIHKYYDLNQALNEIKSTGFKLFNVEHKWHKFTNIISTYHYFNSLNHEQD